LLVRLFSIFKKGKGSQVKGYGDLRGLTIGTDIRGKYFEPFDSDTTLDKFEVPFKIQLFKMLEAGRIDTFAGNEITFDETLKKAGFEKMFEKAPYRVDTKVKGGIVISKKSPFAKDRFKIGEFIRQLLDSGKIMEIELKYDYFSPL